MRAVVQRVSQASVAIHGKTVGQIGQGSLVLLGVEDGDAEKDWFYIADRTAHLRIFDDGDGKMNRSLLDICGSMLVISQFTLLGDARNGRRPSFITAARPETAIPIYEKMVTDWQGMGIRVETGQFGAHMDVSLINDGPVTILLDSRKRF